MITEKDILAALSTVHGPDGRTPLPQSGALAGISVREANVDVSITIEPGQAKAMEPMRLRALAALDDLPGIENARVILTAERPRGASAGGSTSPPERPLGSRAQAARAGNPVSGVDRIIAVASGKGGVGKSTTASNVALGLAGLGLRVGVLDADIYGPSLPRLFGLSGRPELLEGRLMRPLEAFGVKVMSIGFLVEEETPMIWRGPMVMSALNQMLREVAWGELDILVVDMPPGTGDAQLTLAQAVPLAGALIVSTPQDLALIDARRAIAMFRRVDVPILGLVENMSYFLCPNCGARSDIFAHGGARQEAVRLAVPFLGEIPLALTIRENSDAGRPMAISEPNGPHAAIYKAIAAEVWTNLKAGAAGKRPAPRIIIE